MLPELDFSFAAFFAHFRALGISHSPNRFCVDL
jgi:hypothetical protein